MAVLHFQLGSGGQPGSKAGSRLRRTLLFLFATPFAAFGVSAIWQAVKRLQAEDTKGAGLLASFGMVFSAVGFGLMYGAATAERRRKAAEAKWLAQTEGGKKPWLARDDWAAGKIKSTADSQWKISLLIGVMFIGIGGAISWAAISQELPKGNHAALIALVFPLAGLGAVIAAIRAGLARRRFGDCFFELAQVPASPGGTLDGLMQTSAPLKLEASLHLKFTCIRRTVTGSDKSRQTHESILWQDEKVLRQDASLPSTGAGGTGVPVHFPVPADQPEAVLRGNPTVIWRLEAKSKMHGPDFSVAFEVPVFRVAGAETRAADDEPDPTAPLQLSAEEIRRDEHSRIQVTDGPQGREFYFPAARNAGSALMLTVILMVWSGGLWLMIVKHAPLLFPMVFGLFELFLLWGCFAAWFKSSRITINGTRVELLNRWLVFGRPRQFAANDVARFEAKIGMTSGTKTFNDIKLVLRANEQDNFAARQERDQQTGERPPLAFKIGSPSGITVGSDIAGKPETDWLVREMNRALGRKT